jgi:hypothetical protein
MLPGALNINATIPPFSFVARDKGKMFRYKNKEQNLETQNWEPGRLAEANSSFCQHSFLRSIKKNI